MTATNERGASEGLWGALRLAVKTAEAMVYRCGHPRGGCENHCDPLVKVIHAGRAALSQGGEGTAAQCQDYVEYANYVGNSVMRNVMPETFGSWITGRNG
jgi:hypothetical protein